MIQNALKIVTVGFFISMISGFVMYRSGYFDSEKTTHSLQTSPNGGELYLAQVDQDSTKSPEINQNRSEPIMPSSKSISPVITIQEEKKPIMPSSKSLLHPIELDAEEWKDIDPMMYSSKSMTHVIDVKPTPNQLAEEDREAYRKQPELTEDSLDEVSDSTLRKSDKIDNGSKMKASSGTTSTAINWRGIWIGVLGILFVAIGSIVYFKRRSK